MIFNSQCFRILRHFAEHQGKPGASVLEMVVKFYIPAPHQRITELRQAGWDIRHHVVDGVHLYYMNRTEARRAWKTVNAITSAHLSRRMKEAA